MGLESLLLGAHAEGVRNVLAITGDPPEVGDYPGPRGVYQVDAIGLTQLVAALNRGEDYNGRPIDAPTSFFFGVAVNPSADDLETRAASASGEARGGRAFAMTQILFDLAYLDRFLERLGGSSPIPLLVGLLPLSSCQLALRLHNEVPGIVVPEPLQERLRAAGAGRARTWASARARAAARGGRRRPRGLRRGAVPAAAGRARAPGVACAVTSTLARAAPPGSTIGIVTPGSPPETRAEVERGVAWWEAQGYRVRLMPGALEQDGLHGGSPKSAPAICRRCSPTRRSA